MGRGRDELENQGQSRDEAEAMAVDERGAGLTTGGGADRVSLGYLHTVHPDTGQEVVFVPGEALPDWAIEVQNTQVADRHRTRAATAKGAPAGKRAVRSSEGKAAK